MTLPELKFSANIFRLCVIAFVIITAYTVIGIRLWNIQVLSGQEYREKVSKLYARKIRIPSIRGNIISADGRILAGNRASYNVQFHLSEMRKPGKRSKTVDHIMSELKRVAAAIGRKNEITGEDIAYHMNIYPGIPMTVFRDLSPAELARAAENSPPIEGMEIVAEPIREYHYGKLACHILGYVGPGDPKTQEDRSEYFYYIPDVIGKSGLEKLYDDKLRGTPGKKLVIVNHRGFIHEEVGKPSPAQKGFDIQLTIEARAQHIAEKLLSGKSGAMIVMDASSGAIIAMASSPGFDPSLFVPKISSSEYARLLKEPGNPFVNKCTMGSYMPGSIIKPLVAISALENNLSPDDTVVCDGATPVANTRIRCASWKSGGHGSVDMKHAIERSCNDYFIETGLKLGLEKLSRTFSSAGIGSPTGFALAERSGRLPSRDSNPKWNIFDTALISIGQGQVEITPIQAVTYTAAIANGGIIWRPYILKQIMDSSANVMHPTIPEKKSHLDAAPESISTVQEGMRLAVNSNTGSAKNARNSKIELCGKTGTAEIGPIGARYKNTWFIAFGKDVETGKLYSIVVLVEHGTSGGGSCAPLASAFFEEWLP